MSSATLPSHLCIHKGFTLPRQGRVNGRRTYVPLRIKALQTPPNTEELIELGKTGLKVTSVGVGAWSWGDRSGYWGYGRDYGKSDNLTAYEGIVNSGINFIDTAEVYGFGKSEEFLGEFIKQTGTRPLVATKFAPLPWRFTSDSVVMALRASLDRLQLSEVDVYMIHWPGFFVNAFSNGAYLEGLAACHQQGLAKAVGVSNFNNNRLREAHKKLQDAGIPLSHNQVQYSLLYRTPEKNGVLESCRELGVTLMAYSPLCQGLLTGKYSTSFKPGGARAGIFTDSRIREVEPLIGLIREIGEGNSGKTPAQVALNWCICKGVFPIPGAKNARQVEELAGAMGWRLTREEVAALDAASDKIPTNLGAPFENW